MSYGAMLGDTKLGIFEADDEDQALLIAQDLAEDAGFSEEEQMDIIVYDAS